MQEPAGQAQMMVSAQDVLAFYAGIILGGLWCRNLHASSVSDTPS